MTSTGSVEDVVDAADGWPSVRHRVSQGRNRVLLPGHYLVHGHCGQHLQPDCRTRRFYTLDCFTEQLVGLSVTQSITEKRKWRLSLSRSTQ